MPDLTNDQLTLALALVAGVALIVLAVVIALAVRLRKIRRDYVLMRGDSGEKDIVSVVGQAMNRIGSLNVKLDDLEHALRNEANAARLALQRFYLVRYDAFEDMGGRLSFSAALLDDYGDGLVITSINGRTETRTYAKPIHRLSSSHNLSDEEREAIAGAAEHLDRGVLPQSTSRRASSSSSR